MRRLLVVILAPFIVSACGGGSTPTTPTPQGAACTVSVPQTQMNVTATAGSTAIPLTAASNCSWTVTSSQPWLTITSGTGGTGSASVTFSVAENTGAQRTATVTIGGVAITVTQAAGLPPVTVAGTVPAQVQAGTAVNVQFTATGGNGGPYSFAFQTGVGFQPIGWSLSTGGLLTGTANTAGTSTFGVCATDTGGRQGCATFNVTITAPATTGGAFLGAWSGTIVLQVGCTTPLPQNYPWTGTFSTAANGRTELRISVPRALFVDTVPVTITGQRLSITVDIDGPYNFVADFSADFRSFTGTFNGTKCNINPPDTFPSGTWNGAKQ